MTLNNIATILSLMFRHFISSSTSLHLRCPIVVYIYKIFYNLCGFDGEVNLSEAMQTLLACIGKYKECVAPLEQDERAIIPSVQPNELQSVLATLQGYSRFSITASQQLASLTQEYSLVESQQLVPRRFIQHA